MNNSAAKNQHGDNVSQDQFFDGQFEVLQPIKGGHRGGIDALLLAASLPEDSEGKMADFGAGCGTVGMAALVHNPKLSADLIEANPDMATLCRAGLKLPANQTFAHRANIIEADVTKSGLAREAEGLINDSYDYVLMNPPYNQSGFRPSPHAMRESAHMMGHAGLDPWLRSAAATLRPNGEIFLIVRPTAIGLVLAGFQGRFGNAKLMCVHSFKDAPATKLIVRAKKGSKAELEFLPPFIVHEDDKTYTPEADAIFHGNGLVPQMQF